MKKVLSFVLVLAMILGSVSFAFAGQFTDVPDSANCADAVNALVDLGVVNGKTATTYEPGSIVTRAEMAKLVVAALGLDPSASSATQFSDVPASHWASGYIAYAASFGIIKGRSATIFDPEATVSYDEAITMLVRALGYTDESLTGTYPAAYVSKAKALGILETCKTVGSTGANRGDIACLLYDALDAQIGTVDADNKWNASAGSSAVGTDTMRARLVKEATGATVLLTTALAESAKIDIYNLAGNYAKVTRNNDGDIVAVDEVKSVTLVGDVIKDGSTYKFETADQKYEYKLANGYAWTDLAGVVHEAYSSANGKVDTTATSNAIEAILKDTDNTGITVIAKTSGVYITQVYAVFDLAADTTIKVDADDLDDIADKKIEGYKFPVDKYKAVDYKAFGLFGVSKLDEIKKDDIVTIYTDGTYVTRLEVSDKVVEGTVSKVSGSKYTVDGTAYKFATGNNGIDTPLTALTVDDEVKLYLNYAGKVATYDANSSADTNYAVVLNFQNKDDASYSSKDCKIKLVLADGTQAEYVVKPATVNNGTILNTATGVWNPANITAGSIVKYGLNTKGELVSLTVADVTVKAGLDVSSKGYLDGNKIKSNVVAFVYDIALPGGFVNNKTKLSTDADDYSITNYNALIGLESVRVKYVLKSGEIIAMMLDNSATSDTGRVFALYDSTFKTADIDNGYAVIIVGDTAKTEYAAENAIGAFTSAAGIVQLKFNASGEIKSVEVNPDVMGTKDSTSMGSVTVSSAATTIKMNKSKIEFVGENVTGAGLAYAGTLAGAGVVTNASILVEEDILTIYKWNASDSCFEKKTFNNVKATSAAEKDEVWQFYDLAGDENYYDTIVIY